MLGRAGYTLGFVAHLENLLDDVVDDEEAEDAFAAEDEEVLRRDVT